MLVVGFMFRPSGVAFALLNSVNSRKQCYGRLDSNMITMTKERSDVSTSGYQHTQESRVRRIAVPAIVVLLIGCWLTQNVLGLWIVFLAFAATFAFILAICQRMTVLDEGEFIVIRWGPVPCLRARIRCDTIREVNAGRTRFIDGWGIHYVPWRGWTYNLWGFDCAILKTDRGTIRIGTDDASNLVHYLREKIARPH